MSEDRTSPHIDVTNPRMGAINAMPGLPSAARSQLDRNHAWGLIMLGMVAIGIAAMFWIVGLGIDLDGPWTVVALVFAVLFTIKAAVVFGIARSSRSIVNGRGRRRLRA